MKYPGEPNVEKQHVDQWLLRPGERAVMGVGDGKTLKLVMEIAPKPRIRWYFKEFLENRTGPALWHSG